MVIPMARLSLIDVFERSISVGASTRSLMLIVNTFSNVPPSPLDSTQMSIVGTTSWFKPDELTRSLPDMLKAPLPASPVPVAKE